MHFTKILPPAPPPSSNPMQMGHRGHRGSRTGTSGPALSGPVTRGTQGHRGGRGHSRKVDSGRTGVKTPTQVFFVKILPYLSFLSFYRSEVYIETPLKNCKNVCNFLKTSLLPASIYIDKFCRSFLYSVIAS